MFLLAEGVVEEVAEDATMAAAVTGADHMAAVVTGGAHHMAVAGAIAITVDGIPDAITDVAGAIDDRGGLRSRPV